MELKRFKTTSREELGSMTENEIRALNDWEKIERYLIVNGYTDHEVARKIEVEDIRDTGYGTKEFTVISTRPRCRKPAFFHEFRIDCIYKRAELIGFGDF